MTNRRRFLAGSSAIALAVWAGVAGRSRAQTAPKGTFEVVKTDAEWHKILTPAQFDILREQGTEPPFSSPLDHEFGKGLYACAGCALPLYSSDTKYDSGTGWPSFWKPLEHAISTQSDSSLMMDRTEVHCRRCGGHLGHVFDDGPKPTGLRYCMNGAVLTFEPGKSA